eukprot:51954-Eustigmatos_ZCMA.PRE.1
MSCVGGKHDLQPMGWTEEWDTQRALYQKLKSQLSGDAGYHESIYELLQLLKGKALPRNMPQEVHQLATKVGAVNVELFEELACGDLDDLDLSRPPLLHGKPSFLKRSRVIPYERNNCSVRVKDFIKAEPPTDVDPQHAMKAYRHA